jgi:hypothetical protein
MYTEGWAEGRSEFNGSSAEMFFPRARSVLLVSLDNVTSIL